jgi:hypothetical protein
MTTAPAALPGKASIGRVLLDQRKIELVALGMMVFSLWFYQAGSWVLPLCLIIGIAIGLINHLVTEYSLLKVITGGHEPTRAQLTRNTIARLAVVAVVAIGAAVAFWHPDHYGIGVLLGLAIFRLIALVMTTIPLLKELRNQ